MYIYHVLINALSAHIIHINPPGARPAAALSLQNPMQREVTVLKMIPGYNFKNH